MPVTFTDDAWVVSLERALDQRMRNVQKYEDYYCGRHPLAFTTHKFREAFGDLLEAFATNWCQLVVDAAVERMMVTGFLFGGDSADEQAWAIWQANQMDAQSVKLHTEAVKQGVAYLLVDPYAPTGAIPRITVEHPSQMIVAYDRSDTTRRLAALKRWRDLDGSDHATLWLPDRILRYSTPATYSADYGADIMGIVLPRGVNVGFVGGRWRLDEARVNPLGSVPVIPIVNNPTMMEVDGISDLRTAVALNDAANKFFGDMIVASEFAAYPQRVLSGVEVPEDANGNPMTDLVAGTSRTWIFENPESKAQQFQAADLGNYVKAIDTTIQHIAAQTRTPPHYLLGQIVNLSADALIAAETGLVARVRRKMIDFSDGYEEAMRLAFKATGQAAKAQDTGAEVLWRNPENRTVGQVSDAMLKRRQLSVPLEQLWTEMDYTPQQIVRMKQMAGLPQRPPIGATSGANLILDPSTGQPAASASPAVGPATPPGGQQ